jgi:hypothetical protein
MEQATAPLVWAWQFVTERAEVATAVCSHAEAEHVPL